jgi:hypothetical protein
VTVALPHEAVLHEKLIERVSSIPFFGMFQNASTPPAEQEILTAFFLGAFSVSVSFVLFDATSAVSPGAISWRS